MHTYDFHLLDFTPNAVACMALFAHLCEGFVGVHPNTALFRHYLFPRIQKGGTISGCVAWIPRSKGTYLGHSEGEVGGVAGLVVLD